MGSVEDEKKVRQVPTKSEDGRQPRAKIGGYAVVHTQVELRRYAFPFLAKIKKSEKRTKIIWEKS